MKEPVDLDINSFGADEAGMSCLLLQEPELMVGLVNLRNSDLFSGRLG